MSPTEAAKKSLMFWKQTFWTYAQQNPDLYLKEGGPMTAAFYHVHFICDAVMSQIAQAEQHQRKMERFNAS